MRYTIQHPKRTIGHIYGPKKLTYTEMMSLPVPQRRDHFYRFTSEEVSKWLGENAIYERAREGRAEPDDPKV